jgi:hypothetical protein
MVTTIQVNEKTLMLLKKLKAELKVKSYEEALTRVVVERAGRKSMAGFLGRKYGKMSKREILEGLREKNDRY